MNILILGGTGFIGPHMIKAAIDRGHKVTMFNRGRSQPRFFKDMFDNVEALVGDRGESLDALGEDRRWDAVIDTSAYYPRVVDMAASKLKDRTDQYVFISTMSVYAERDDIDMDEDAPLGTIDDPATEEVNGLTYGPLKVLCEQKLLEHIPDRSTIIRPGVIVGKGDHTNRFTYWPARAHRAAMMDERMLCPGSGDDYMQYIDVRDLAEWQVRAIEQKHLGIYNAVTPARARTTSSTIGAAIAEAEAVAGKPVVHAWGPTELLIENGVAPWQHMPLWIPPTMDGNAAYGQASVQRIIDAGMTYRTERDSAASALSWWLGRPQEDREEHWARLATAESAAPGAGRRGVPGCPRDLEAAVLEELDAQPG